MKFVVSTVCVLLTTLVVSTGCASSSQSSRTEKLPAERHWAVTENQVPDDAGWTMRPVSDNP